ncbi:MAG TPA: CBS domain-containing protein [Kofleriaceae bacterium]|jgi:CBS-domain-containing membrane protein|nr:CBS domain-containing protein [Kofleriaceae bacterium]
MTLLQLLTPIADVSWLSVTDTVGDAFDHLETYELSAAPLVDRTGRYAGTVTQADLRRHAAGAADRAAALATPLSVIERRARNPAVSVDRDPGSLADAAAAHGFVPVADATGKLVGIIDRRRLLDLHQPSAP